MLFCMVTHDRRRELSGFFNQPIQLRIIPAILSANQKGGSGDEMRLLKICTVVGMLLLVFGCGDDSGGGSSDGGTVTPPTPTPTAAKLDITTDNYQLKTNGLDKATLTIGRP